MPELPEVETIRRGLETYLVGRIIEDIEVRFPKIFTGDEKLCKSAKIQAIRRFGKGLVIDLDNDHSIVAHVKMTGQFIYKGDEVSKGRVIAKKKTGDDVPGKHTHVIFKLKAKREKRKIDFLYYNDIRKFGWLKVVPTNQVEELSFFKSLGPEPLKSLTYEYFRDLVKKGQGPIKTFLMDQKKIAGVGNIYANDALYLAKIHPTRKANSLTDRESQLLFQSIETVLHKGLEAGGASERNYVNALGEAGEYQKFFKVYNKQDKPCPVCGTPVEKIILSGRGTFFCPNCQK